MSGQPLRRRRALTALATLAVAAALSGCGIAVDAAPQPLPGNLLGNLENTPNTAGPTVSPHCGTNCVTIYLTDGAGNLVATLRKLPHPLEVTHPVEALQAALNELTAGPTYSELVQAGLGTYLPGPNSSDVEGGTQVAPQLSVTELRPDGVVTVQLDQATADLNGYDLFEALGQIVWTLVSPQFPKVRGVLFFFGGGPFAALVANDIFTSDPVTRADYSQIRPQAQ